MSESAPLLFAAILAAGQSSRFKNDAMSSKLCHPMPDGRSLIEHSLDAYRALNLRPHVLLRADDNALVRILDSIGAEYSFVDYAERGMSESIKEAARLAEESNAEALMIGLADMPFLDEGALGELITSSDSAFASAKAESAPNYIVAPCKTDTSAENIEHQNSVQQNDVQLGHPVIFSAEYFSPLKALQGDVGAKSIIKNNTEHLCYVPVTDQGCYRDVDYLADLF